jgi:hypothetical protein
VEGIEPWDFSLKTWDKTVTFPWIVWLVSDICVRGPFSDRSDNFSN